MSHTKGEPDRYYFYTTSLHWTLTMFTPASMEVVPENAFERVYCILTILSAIIVFSSFVSSITTAVSTFRRKRDEQVKQNADLVGFLQENRISLKLGTMIQTFMQKHVTRPSQVHRIHESDVPQLKQLPLFLREELAYEVYKPVICCHPLLRSALSIDNTFISSICQTAMSPKSVMPMIDVFGLGDECKAMYFVVAGELAYFRGLSSTPKAPGEC